MEQSGSTFLNKGTRSLRNANASWYLELLHTAQRYAITALAAEVHSAWHNTILSFISVDATMPIITDSAAVVSLGVDGPQQRLFLAGFAAASVAASELSSRPSLLHTCGVDQRKVDGNQTQKGSVFPLSTKSALWQSRLYHCGAR